MSTDDIRIRLSDEQRRFVQERIDAGEFESAEALLADLLGRYQKYVAWREDAREKIREGVEAAERGDLIDGEEFMAKWEERLRRAAAEEERRGKRSA